MGPPNATEGVLNPEAIVPKKLLLLTSLLALIAVTGARLSSDAPYDDATALLDEYVENLGELYARGASPDEVRDMTAAYEAELATVFTDLSSDERQAFKDMTEQRIAGSLWGMQR